MQCVLSKSSFRLFSSSWAGDLLSVSQHIVRASPSSNRVHSGCCAFAFIGHSERPCCFVEGWPGLLRGRYHNLGNTSRFKVRMMLSAPFFWKTSSPLRCCNGLKCRCKSDMDYCGCKISWGFNKRPVFIAFWSWIWWVSSFSEMLKSAESQMAS